MIPPAPLGTDAAAGRPQGLGAAAAGGLDAAAAERRFRFELAAHPGSPAQARSLTRARLTGWSVCEDTCDTAALVISELVTNAIVHSASDLVVCELSDSGDLVRIAVHDEGCAPGDPHPSPQRPEEEHGRGLLLVEALCHAWGAQEHGSGLLVWADLPRGAEVQTPAEASVVHAEPRDDLGWGARPKPGPADGSRDEDESAEQTRRGQWGDGTAARQGEDPASGPASPRGDGPADLPDGAAQAEAHAAPTGHAIRPSVHRTPDAGAQAIHPPRPPHHLPEAGDAAPRTAPQWHHDSEHQGLDDRGSTHHHPEHPALIHPGPEHHPADHCPPGHHLGGEQHVGERCGPGQLGPVHPGSTRLALQPCHSPAVLGEIPAPALPVLERTPERGWV